MRSRESLLGSTRSDGRRSSAGLTRVKGRHDETRGIFRIRRTPTYQIAAHPQVLSRAAFETSSPSLITVRPITPFKKGLIASTARAWTSHHEEELASFCNTGAVE